MFSAFQTFGKLGASASAAPFSPTKLFAAGEAGGVWDFTTLANLYQDSAGTTPCTAVGDPIGKVLDTSGRGNHLTQSTSTKRPTLGRMPATGVRNLLTKTEEFSDTSVWTVAARATVSANVTTAPNGTLTADKLIPTNGSIGGYLASPGALAPSGVAAVLSCFAKAGEFDKFTLYANTTAGDKQADFDLTLGTLVSVTSGASAEITPVVGYTGWYRCSMSYTVGGAGQVLLWATQTGDGTSGLYVWGAQLNLGSTALPYQRVGAVYDVTESGVASVYTAYFDGVDDCLVSPSIDFSGTDAMSVFSGFRKTSDAARGMVAELSATTDSNNGSFALTAPNAASATIVYESKGTSLTDTSATIVAPADSVISAVSDISADSNVLRRNGVQADSDTGDQGTGNFGNYPLYVGQRGAASLPYKGFLSALCARGAATDATTITSMEQWLAARTPGVTL